jgi:hypothetical protein
MSDGFPNKPRILRGAFVEFGLSVPPLVVVFQFNPVQLSRNRSLTFTGDASTKAGSSLRDFHRQAKYSDLLALRKDQIVTVAEQTIGFNLRLDATDRLDDADPVTVSLGIGPQISTLELMVVPKEEGVLSRTLPAALTQSGAFSFQDAPKPPLVLFIFGRKRVLPVNITSLNITETEFSATLDPIRADITVGLTVIEGPNGPYTYTRAAAEAMSLLGLGGAPGVADVVIPG